MCPLQIEGMIDATYDDFLSAVARGRGMSKAAVREVAKGRVWTGSQAMEVGKRECVCVCSVVLICERLRAEISACLRRL